MEMRVISLKLPVDFVERVDALVKAEAEAIGLPVDRTGFIARALREDVERREAVQQERQAAA